MCKTCKAIEGKYQPQINETFVRRQLLEDEWKNESLEAEKESKCEPKL